ncbi:MAG: hypothetical protein VKO39_11680 [Cyanobacteriota bacterium]|nr:hypothetical protein [Cyanobacteriota bacterium]
MTASILTSQVLPVCQGLKPVDNRMPAGDLGDLTRQQLTIKRESLTLRAQRLHLWEERGGWCRAIAAAWMEPASACAWPAKAN